MREGRFRRGGRGSSLLPLAPASPMPAGLHYRLRTATVGAGRCLGSARLGKSGEHSRRSTWRPRPIWQRQEQAQGWRPAQSAQGSSQGENSQGERGSEAARGEADGHVAEDRLNLQLAEELDRRRRVRETGLAFAVGIMGTGLALLGALDSCDTAGQLPPGLAPMLVSAGAAMVGGVTLPQLGGDCAVQVGRLATLECVGGRMYAQPGVRPSGGAIRPGDVAVRQTGDARGRGAFATTAIPKDTMLTEYEGDMLSNVEYFQRYPDGVSDYCMMLDAERVIDAAVASQGNDFTAGHVNHSRLRNNVVRWYDRRQGRIWFYASRDIRPGEELLVDYGRTFWQGREELELE
mmetsp:Transcript_23386/g.59041  ORF Transcript_23386/g.59041 Transcript_23386/m.59041 type:complete len:348 (-) Transcript_23386:352-1395(-)